MQCFFLCYLVRTFIYTLYMCLSTQHCLALAVRESLVTYMNIFIILSLSELFSNLEPSFHHFAEIASWSVCQCQYCQHCKRAVRRECFKFFFIHPMLWPLASSLTLSSYAQHGFPATTIPSVVLGGTSTTCPRTSSSASSGSTHESVPSVKTLNCRQCSNEIQ